MLRISLHLTPQAGTFRLEGKLSGPWVREFERCWENAQPGLEGRRVLVDLAQVDFVDAPGKALLARLHESGAEFIARSPLTKAVVGEIIRAGKAVVLLLAAGLLMAPRPASAQATPPATNPPVAVPLPPASQPPASAAPAPAPAPFISTEQAPLPPGPIPPALRLTLRDAVQIALRQSPQTQLAVLNIALAQEQALTARAALLPQAGLQTFERDQRFNLEALMGRPFPGFPQHVGPFAIWQGAATGSAPVLDLTAWRRWRAARQNIQSVNAQRTTVREQVTSLVVSQYLGGLRASADVSAAQSRVNLAQALYNQAADLQRAGVGTGIDTLRANVELQAEKQRLLVSQTQQQTALFGLARLLNLDPRQPIELSDAMSFFETPPVAPAQTLDAALTHRPELLVLSFRNQALASQVAAARAARYPNLTADGFWGYQGLNSPAGSIPAYTFEITANIPLFTGGRIQSEIAQAEIQQRQLTQQRQETVNQIAYEVNTALAQLASARNEVDVANLGIKLAQEEVTQARDRFQAGVANNIEVITAQDELARASDNQIAALYRYNQARADLARATGQMENLYAK